MNKKVVVPKFSDVVSRLKFLVKEKEDIKHDLENANRAAQNVLEDLQSEKDKLAKAKVKDEAILASIGDGVIVVSSDKRIIVMNKMAEKLLGWEIKEAIGKFYDEVILLENEKGTFIPLEERPLAKAFAGSTTTTTTTSVLYLLSKNKIKFPVAITVSPVILDNKIIGAVEVFRDITKEQEIDKAKSEFVSLASHQLRTPLTTISWYTEMILNGDVGAVVPEQKKYLEEIYEGNKRMIELVNTLLDVSRIEMGTFKAEPKKTDIIKLAESVLNEQKPKIEQKKLEIIEKFDRDVPIFLIDSKLLRIVFQNLLANAIEYTSPEGKIEFAISFQSKKTILIKVSDTGYGIPKNQQDKIFTKLFRADNIREKAINGTGLGLYITKSVVLNLGGEIWFESKENKGTTFYVTLPFTNNL